MKLRPNLEPASHKMKSNSSVKLGFFEKNNVPQKITENIEKPGKRRQFKKFKFCIYCTITTLNLLLVILY